MIGSSQNEPKGWSPYVAGALVGLLMVMSVWVSGKYFGASTTFVRAAGLVERQFNQERVSKMDYFIKEAPKVDWQFLFVIGIFFGSLISATTSKSFQLRAVPPMWENRFGSSPVKRGIVAFLGGGIAMFGARLADG
jgi:uncharacterized protein